MVRTHTRWFLERTARLRFLATTMMPSFTAVHGYRVDLRASTPVAPGMCRSRIKEPDRQTAQVSEQGGDLVVQAGAGA